MKKLSTKFMILLVCAVIGGLMTASANAMERSDFHTRSFRDSHRGYFRSGAAWRGRGEYHRRFHDRDFAGFYPGVYTYYSGNYVSYPAAYENCPYSYQPGYPAMGTVLITLPYGYSTLVLNGITYYTHDGVYYEYTPQGYVVVPRPC